MPELFDVVILDNRLIDYLIVALVIGLFLALRRVLSRVVAALIGRWVISRRGRFDRGRLEMMVLEPIQFFLLVLVVIIAFDRLKFPEALNIEIYRTRLQPVMEAIARAVLIGAFIWLCNRLIAFFAQLLHERAVQTSDRTDDQLVIFFRDFLRVIVTILGILLILKFSFGFPLSNVFTALSIVSAALALAFRESLENLIASFIIFFDKPFTTGDLVKVENVTGTIENIGLRSTRIRTTEKTYTSVPNKKMVDTIVDNQSLRSQRNVFTTLEISLAAGSAQIARLIESIEAMLKDYPGILDYNVYFAETGQQAHVVRADYFVTMDISFKEFLKLREQVNLRLTALIEEQDLELANRNLDVAIQQRDN